MTGLLATTTTSTLQLPTAAHIIIDIRRRAKVHLVKHLVWEHLKSMEPHLGTSILVLHLAFSCAKSKNSQRKVWNVSRPRHNRSAHTRRVYPRKKRKNCTTIHRVALGTYSSCCASPRHETANKRQSGHPRRQPDACDSPLTSGPSLESSLSSRMPRGTKQAAAHPTMQER